MQKRNHIAIYNVSALRPSNKTQMQHYLQQVTPSILQNTLNVVIHEMPALMRCNKIRNTTNYVFSPFQRCSKIATYHAGATISRPSMQPLCYLPHCRQNLHMFLCETLVFCIYGHQQLHIGHARTFTFAKLKPQSPYIYIERETKEKHIYLQIRPPCKHLAIRNKISKGSNISAMHASIPTQMHTIFTYRYVCMCTNTYVPCIPKFIRHR